MKSSPHPPHPFLPGLIVLVGSVCSACFCILLFHIISGNVSVKSVSFGIASAVPCAVCGACLCAMLGRTRAECGGLHGANEEEPALRNAASGTIAPAAPVHDPEFVQKQEQEKLLRHARTLQEQLCGPVICELCNSISHSLSSTTEPKTEFRDQAKSLGATGWIVKPCDPAKLLETMGYILP